MLHLYYHGARLKFDGRPMLIFQKGNYLTVQTKVWIRNIRLCRLETAFMHIPSFYQYTCISLVQTIWESIFPLFGKFLYTISARHSFKCNLYNTLYNQFDWLIGLVDYLGLLVCINRNATNKSDYLDIIRNTKRSISFCQSPWHSNSALQINGYTLWQNSFSCTAGFSL